MSYNFDLHAHVVLPQTRHSDCSPNRLVIWHIFPEVSDHCCQCLVIDWNVIRVDAINLGPASATCIEEASLNISESKVDLGIDLRLKFASLIVPSA